MKAVIEEKSSFFTCDGKSPVVKVLKRMQIIKTKIEFWNFVLCKIAQSCVLAVKWTEKKILISFRGWKRYNFGISILKHIVVYKEKVILQFMKCCRKNLFRNQTDSGICWSSASEGHCRKNSNRHSVNQISALFTSRDEDPLSTRKILVVWLLYMQKSRSVRLTIAVSDPPLFLCGLSQVQGTS